MQQRVLLGAELAVAELLLQQRYVDPRPKEWPGAAVAQRETCYEPVGSKVRWTRR